MRFAAADPVKAVAPVGLCGQKAPPGARPPASHLAFELPPEGQQHPKIFDDAEVLLQSEEMAKVAEPRSIVLPVTVDILSGPGDDALIRSRESRENPEQAGFSRPVCPLDPHHFTGIDSNIQRFEQGDLASIAGQSGSQQSRGTRNRIGGQWGKACH